MEIGGKKLNFLDVTLITITIEFDWFHKPTFSGRYLISCFTLFLLLYLISPSYSKKGIFNEHDRVSLLSFKILWKKS